MENPFAPDDAAGSGRAPARSGSAESSVDILEAAIHTLAYRDRGLALSDALLELSPDVSNLFSSFILKGMQSTGARMARFEAGSAACQAALKILDDTVGLLEGSRLLASHLFSSMQGKNASAADLAVVRAMDLDGGQMLLAILKLDLQSGFRREVFEVDGETRVRLVPVMDLLPDAERRMQKCAFVPAPPHSFPYDLLVLDQQAGGRAGADFFTARFLECRAIDGPREFTRRLPEETERWLQEESLPPAVAIQTRQAVIQAIAEPEVNLERLAEQTFNEPDRRQRFLDHMESSGFESAGFSTDRSAANRLSSTLTYLLDGGVRITGEAEAVAELLQVDADPTEEGKVRIVIESFRFERKY